MYFNSFITNIMQKLNGLVNRHWETVYLNLRKEEVAKLNWNIHWKTCIKLTQQWYIFTFAPDLKPDLLDNIEECQ